MTTAEGRVHKHAPCPRLQKFLAHGNGVAIVRAYTSAGWFHDLAVHAETMLFPRGKTKFIRPDGTIGTAPGHGIVLLGMGRAANEALRRSGLGLFVPLKAVIVASIRRRRPGEIGQVLEQAWQGMRSGVDLADPAGQGHSAPHRGGRVRCSVR